ncbi:MAG: N-acyl-D-amino-acid deacylase [Bacillota bacterium]|nr:N-acyl-D-amino-acid deacylase [Bacillota bacterium]
MGLSIARRLPDHDERFTKKKGKSMFDLVVKNGLVVDPANRVHSRLNIGVRDGKIARVTGEPITGRTEIDAEGLVVTPGFIDMHMHEDPYDSKKNAFDFMISDTMLRMGVTTAIGGNCGIGYEDPAAYLNAVDRLGFPVNLGMFAPHECIRNAVGSFGRYDAVDPIYFDKMKEFLRTQLESGCVGLSMGLEYDPGLGEAEVLALMQVAADRGKLTAVHQRSDGNLAVTSVREVLDYAQATRGALQISHLSSMCSFGTMEEILAIIDDARLRGIDAGFDGYPYYAFCTYLGSAVFDDGFLDKYSGGESLYTKLQAASGELQGESLNRESFLELREKSPDTLIVAHILNEREVDLCLSHPNGIIVSDGLYSDGKGHPRGSGTFPKFIREFVFHKKQMSLDTAIEKITYLPAFRLGLNAKGALSAGKDADITIFDPETITDEATYQEPFKAPSGIEYVIINGGIALKQGDILNRSLGRSVRI